MLTPPPLRCKPAKTTCPIQHLRQQQLLHVHACACVRVPCSYCYLTHAASACCVQNSQRNDATQRNATRPRSLALTLSCASVSPFLHKAAQQAASSMNHFRFRQQHGRHYGKSEKQWQQRQRPRQRGSGRASTGRRAAQTKVNERRRESVLVLVRVCVSFAVFVACVLS